jgi:uncharacterized protein
MESNETQQPVPSLAPITAAERIQALDVVRGFALFGIFLMNVEFFNRSVADIGLGIPPGLSGVDWFASWFVAYFVQGKFWTVFSLLFGMGFAVMLTRARGSGRSFIRTYLRRIIGLATFGAAHFIFLWAGDILFSYAVAAGGLLILLYGTWKPILIAVVLLVAIAFIPGLASVGGIAAVLAFFGMLALYIRSERNVTLLDWRVPLFSFVLLVIGTIGVVATPILWVLPDVPAEARAPVTVTTIVALIVAALSARFKNPADLRSLRLGGGIYVVMSVMMIAIGAIQYLTPPEPDFPAGKIAQADIESPEVADTGDVGESETPEPADSPDAEEEGAKAVRSAAEIAAEKKAEKKEKRARRLEERAEKAHEEEQILSQGRYLDAVELRARGFPEAAAQNALSSSILIAMFLIGVWFVQSGVMADTKAHLALFRKLAIYALPFGIALGLLGSLISISHTPGDDHDGFQLAMGLAVLGNLPASLGYVGMVVVMLHSDSVFSRISVFAPAGRMALTNYLLQSLVSTIIFYGYGFGQWGLPRSLQLVYVIIFFALQVVFSQWWLRRYRYGPLEWLWRGFTYRQTPPMRL